MSSKMLPKVLFFSFFSFATSHFDWPLMTKLLKLCTLPQIKILKVLPLESPVMGFESSNFGQKLWDKVWCYW
jgi:hypothetical protein